MFTNKATIFLDNGACRKITACRQGLHDFVAMTSVQWFRWNCFVAMALFQWSYLDGFCFSLSLRFRNKTVVFLDDRLYRKISVSRQRFQWFCCNGFSAMASLQWFRCNGFFEMALFQRPHSNGFLSSRLTMFANQGPIFLEDGLYQKISARHQGLLSQRKYSISCIYNVHND